MGTVAHPASVINSRHCFRSDGCRSPAQVTANETRLTLCVRPEGEFRLRYLRQSGTQRPRNEDQCERNPQPRCSRSKRSRSPCSRSRYSRPSRSRTQRPNGPRCHPGPHPSAARITSEFAFESSGAAGRAQALTDRNDPTAAPAKARADVFGIKVPPLIDEFDLSCSSRGCICCVGLDEPSVHLFSMTRVQTRYAEALATFRRKIRTGSLCARISQKPNFCKPIRI